MLRGIFFEAWIQMWYVRRRATDGLHEAADAIRKLGGRAAIQTLMIYWHGVILCMYVGVPRVFIPSRCMPSGPLGGIASILSFSLPLPTWLPASLLA